MSRPHVVTPDTVIEPRLEEVAEGVFAYLQLHGQWGLNNSGFIVGRHGGVLVVDTCFTVDRTRAFRQCVETTAERSPTTLVNTHHHGDHTHGNFLFRDTTIIAHEQCRDQMLNTDLESTKALFQDDVDWGRIEIEPPAVTFRDSLTLHVDDIKVVAEHVGPAHTPNDVVYHLPDQGVLFAGDLVFSGGTPFVMMGSVDGSLAAYDRLLTMDVDTIVPGHGPVCGPEVIADMVDYLRLIRATAIEAAQGGVSPLEAARSIDLGAFNEWHDSERVAGNLHRAMHEVAGNAPGSRMDNASAVADMISYNGGQRPRCHA